MFKSKLNFVDTLLRLLNLRTGNYSGFPNRTDSSISTTITSNREFTITGTNFEVFVKGRRFLKNTETLTVDNSTGITHIYYNSDGELDSSPPFFDLKEVAPVAIVYYNADLAEGRAMEERHGMSMSSDTHLLIHNTIGARYQSGLGGSYANTTFEIDSGVFWDEDIEHEISTQTQTRVFYRDALGNFLWTAKSGLYYKESVGGDIQYDNSGTLTNVDSNSYVAYWAFVTNDIDTPIIHVMGQRQDTNIANARANNTFESLVLGDLPFPEYKLLYRIILRNDATPYEETQDLRSISNVPAGTYVATDHNALTGRSNTGVHPVIEDEISILSEQIKVKQDLTLLSASWTDDTGTSGYWIYTVSDTDVDANTVVDVNIHFGCLQNAMDLLPVTVSSANEYKLYATSQPSEDLDYDAKLIKQGGI